MYMYKVVFPRMQNHFAYLIKYVRVKWLQVKAKSKGRLKKYHKDVYKPAAFVSDWLTIGAVVI